MATATRRRPITCLLRRILFEIYSHGRVSASMREAFSLSKSQCSGGNPSRVRTIPAARGRTEKLQVGQQTALHTRSFPCPLETQTSELVLTVYSPEA